MGQTLAEKIFERHVVDKQDDTWILKLDRVFCHEITTPIAITDLMEKGLDTVFDADKIKAVIDHVTPAKDSKTAEQGKILRDWARRQNIKDFFDIGQNGVCHALFPEKGFVEPGFTIIMGDSHTCTYGAFGAFAAGVGTTDLEVGILKGVCSFKRPKTIRVNLNGELPPHVYPKDVILAIIAKLGVAGATDCVLEFRGEVAEHMSIEGRMTLCNMAIEAGATCGVCMPDKITYKYIKRAVSKYSDDEDAHPSVDIDEYKALRSDDDAVYEKTIDIDCSTLVPLATFGYKPDQVKPIEELKGTKIDQVYIGSCTNGRISDLRAAAAVLRDGDAVRQIVPSVRGILSPATPAVYKEALEEGLIEVFMEAGFCVTNPTCGACLGMSNGVLAEGEVCASTTNRNFFGRMGKGGMVHLMSPV
ncbi:MAG: 3-isopropylmalate dehydratase large subunit, partial [Spirochaetaceae bacterium]|nr:3-isopropylmalate dehydratase large subunit [Spirochaetaceae bacterium]